MNIQIKYWFILLTVLGALLPQHFAQAQHPIVRIIYFVPRDRKPQPDIDLKIDKLLKEVQQFYADQMEAHGLGRKTFQLETDVSDKTVVHRVVGQYTDSHYRNLVDTWEVWNEIDEVFDATENIYLTAIDISNEILDGGEVCGRGGSRGHIGGKALIPASGGCFNLRVTAHELGHAFGVKHDFRDNAYIMSYGGSARNQLSKCTADWLCAHRAFNPQFTKQIVSKQIKVLSPVLESFSNTIRHRFEFSGIHQIQFLTETLTGSAAGSLELVNCTTLNGRANAIVEFEDTELTPQTYFETLQTIDVNGVFKRHDLGIPVNRTLLWEPAEVVSIPDVNLAITVREALGLEAADTLTTHIIQYLSTLDVIYTISNLTGLEYAQNLRELDIRPRFRIFIGDIELTTNIVSDISPLMGLTELRKLYLTSNPLSYVSINTYIPVLQRKGIEVEFDNVAHPALLRTSGHEQEDLTGKLLPRPLVVEAQNEYGQPMENIPVTFAIHSGSGMLSNASTKTDIEGKARTTLSLGWTPETAIVRATAENIKSSVYFTATPTVLIHRAAEDVNGDGSVNVEDLMLVAASLGTEPVSNMLPNTDVNNDGVVNNDDVAIVLAALEAGAAAPLAETKTSNVWTTETLARWIGEAKRYHTQHETFLRGIVVLEQLLASLTPKVTTLLPNYPNPFNPETWIPYQLATPAEISISIYAVDGQLVRKLDLGHQPVGIYQDKRRAAYWDGKNTIGENVSSGLYFYRLSAGDFSATRKMLILK